MEKRRRPSHPDILTPREHEVLALLREGLTNPQIAERLGITLDGAKYHVSEILGKLGVASREDAARWEPSDRPWWAGAAAPIAWLWRRASVSWLWTGVTAITAIIVLAGIGLPVWGLLRTDGGEADVETAARVETVIREYLQAVSEADAGLFCARIEPQLGFFSDEDNCLEVQSYAKGGRGDFAPRIRGQLLSDITSQLVAIEDTEVSGDEAVVLAAIRWTAEGQDGLAGLGEAQLTIRLAQAGDAWRIAAFDNSASSPSQDPEVEAASRAVFDYFEDLWQRLRTERGNRHWFETPVSLGEYRSRRIVSAVVGVEFREGYAAVTHDTHYVSNGAIGYPNRYRLVLERGTSGWRQVTNTDLLNTLFEDP